MRRIKYDKTEALIWKRNLSKISDQIGLYLEPPTITKVLGKTAIVHEHGCRMLAVKPEHSRAAACVKYLLVHYSYSSSNGSHIVCVHDMV